MNESPARTKPKTKTYKRSSPDPLDDFLLGPEMSKLFGDAAMVPQQTWVPDGMALAMLATALSPGHHETQQTAQAIETAWAVFVQSQAFCLELKALSAGELAIRIASLRNVNHPNLLLRFIRLSGRPQKMLCYDPSSPKKDAVREFLDVKSTKGLEKIFRKYCHSQDTEREGGLYEALMARASRSDERGIYFEFPLELLEDIKRHRWEVKSFGGYKSSDKYEPVEETIIPD